MVCQICNVNEATIHLTEIVNNQMIEVHICETCAKEKAVDVTPPISFNEVLSGLVDFTVRPESDDVDLRCPTCGLTYRKFRDSGRLGCDRCYHAFQSVLFPLIKRIQGTTHHLGKNPAHLNETYQMELELKELMEKLQEAVATEKFEDAVLLRDKIKMIEKRQMESKDNKKHE